MVGDEILQLVERLADLSGVTKLHPNTNWWSAEETEEVLARFPREELEKKKWYPALLHVLWMAGPMIDSDDVHVEVED